MRQLLTERTLQTLEFEGKPETVWDTNLKGFGIRLLKTTKTFTVMRGKQRERLTIGRYPDWSLKDARKEAQALLAAPPRKNAAMPLKQALKQFIELHCDTLKGGKQMVWNLNAHVKPIALHNVDRQYVQGILDTMTHTPGEANHFFQYFRTFMMWCVRRGLLDHYPLTAMVMPHKRPTRERVLSDNELKAVWNNCGDDTFSTVVKLLILTGQRRGEIKHLIPDSDTATLPAIHAKNGKAHVFPISKQTHELLQKNRSWGGWSKSKAQLDKLCGVTDWTLHDLRRTYATIHAQLGTPIHVIEKLLNHISGKLGGVAGIYNRHSYQTEMRTAVLAYEANISAILNPITLKPEDALAPPVLPHKE